MRNLMDQSLEDEQTNYEFIFGQLLLIANFLNYGDEIGRQQIFTLFRKCFVIFLKEFLFIKKKTKSKINYVQCF